LKIKNIVNQRFINKLKSSRQTYKKCPNKGASTFSRVTHIRVTARGMTHSRTTVSRLTLDSRMTLTRTAFSVMALNKITLSRMTLYKMTQSRMTLYKMTQSRMTLNIIRFSRTTFSRMILGRATFYRITYERMTLDRTTICRMTLIRTICEIEIFRMPFVFWRSSKCRPVECHSAQRDIYLYGLIWSCFFQEIKLSLFDGQIKEPLSFLQSEGDYDSH